MNIMKAFSIFLLCLFLVSCTQENTGYIHNVDPFIGTGGHGHTYPGAVVPHGMVQLSPDTRTNGWDACSGYHYDDGSLIGFSHTHLSGTGIGDLGDILFLPYTNELKTVAPNGDDKEATFGSAFSHRKETAIPGYYSVHLDDYNIDVELTATCRAGFHRYTFPDSEEAGLYIDLTRTIHDRYLAGSELEVVGDCWIRGMKQVAGWAPNRYIYFYACFSEPFTCTVDENRKAYLQFGKTTKDKQILAKVGISFV
jgi:putative alpha-1,2-mannosidase